MTAQIIEHPVAKLTRLYEAVVVTDQKRKLEPTEENVRAANRAWRIWHHEAFASENMRLR